MELGLIGLGFNPAHEAWVSYFQNVGMQRWFILYGIRKLEL